MKRITLLIIGLIWLLTAVFPLSAQDEPTLRLRLSRDFGYGSGTSVEGTFSYRVEGPDNLTEVTFFMDGEVVGSDSEAPYRLQFKTENYELGWHEMWAEGVTADGARLQSNSIRREFVDPQAATSSTVIIVVVLVVLTVGGRLLTNWIANRGRRQTGKPAISGPVGGTICPKCNQPFAMHIWGLNMGLGKFDRCPHCGKWSVVRRVNPDLLAASAEAAEMAARQETAVSEPLSDEEKLRRQLDDSRFDDKP